MVCAVREARVRGWVYYSNGDLADPLYLETLGR